MIVTLKIELCFGLYAEEGWQCTVEVDSSSTLEDLHAVIQQAVDFENDHLYEFYIARAERSRDRIRFDDENEEIYTTTLDSLLPLPKDRKLFYMFDYGDSWLFSVAPTRKKPFAAESGVKYPRLVSEKGTKPEQYPDLEDE